MSLNWKAWWRGVGSVFQIITSYEREPERRPRIQTTEEAFASDREKLAEDRKRVMGEGPQ